MAWKEQKEPSTIEKQSQNISVRQERARKSVKESQKRGDQKIEDHANERSSSLFNRNTNALRNTSLIDYNYSVPNLKQQLRLKYIGRACIQPDENKKNRGARSICQFWKWMALYFRLATIFGELRLLCSSADLVCLDTSAFPICREIRHYKLLSEAIDLVMHFSIYVFVCACYWFCVLDFSFLLSFLCRFFLFPIGFCCNIFKCRVSKGIARECDCCCKKKRGNEREGSEK